MATLYVELINSYEHLYNEINNFTPKEKIERVCQIFQGINEQGCDALGKEVQVLRNEIQGLIKEKQIYSYENINVLSKDTSGVFSSLIDLRELIAPIERDF